MEKLPDEVLEILNKFSEAGYQIYIVGGAVRDLLLDRPVKDWDFTTDAKPEQILELFPEGFSDNKFGTVGVPAGSEIYEITTMRKEGEYKDFRHPEYIGWTNNIEEDLARRDFSVNAMALSVDQYISKSESPQITETPNHRYTDVLVVDPFDGQTDLKSGIISAVGDPNQRFKEDALRLMRAIRIATQLNFEIEEKTFQAIKDNVPLIKEIAWERIRDELFKLLSSDDPYLGIVKLREAGILQIILPELESTFGIVQEGPKHDRVYDIGEHSLLTLKHTPSPDPLVRLAALLHDVGKVETVKKEEDGNVTFYNHDIVGGKIVLQIAKRFNLSKKQADKLYKLVRWHLFCSG